MNSTALLDPRLIPPALRSGDPSARSRDRARRAEPSWARPALITLLIATAAFYLWDLSASDYANSFYAAAVQAGTRSWKAFFFGSLDSSSFITVDKPPASLWVMALSGRIFGFSSLSMLVPQVLEGVAAVALLHAAVKRWFGAGAGLLAGALLAVTPVAALMFRFNNPDALLVLLLVASAYCLTRALEGASTRWMVATGTMLGFAFLAKMGQAFLVVPGFALVYLIAAPTPVRRRLGQLLVGGLAIVVSGGWWVAIVALWPAASRPFIDGSPDNSIINLILGYNGLGRIFGNGNPAHPAGGGGGGGGANFSGTPGILRLFNDAMGGQASWLLPAAGVALLAGLWATRRTPRIDRTRAALVLWGGWLVVSGLVFSLGSGIIHTYYTVALAPAIAALVAIGASMAWRTRETLAGRGVLALAVLVTAGWSFVLLDRTPQWESWLRVVIVVAGVLALLGLLAAPWLRRLGRRLGLAIAACATVACLAGPAAYAAQTVTTAHTGSIPSAGPGGAGGSGLEGGFGGGGGGLTRGAGLGRTGFGPGGARSGALAGGARPGGPGSGAASLGSGAAGLGSRAAGPGAAGASSTSTALEKALTAGTSRYRWVAAVSGSQTAASIELATGGDPVMAIGGFNGQGGNLTLAQFERYVARGEVHYYLAGGGGPGGVGGGGAFGGPGSDSGAGATSGGSGASGAGAASGGSAASGAGETSGASETSGGAGALGALFGHGGSFTPPAGGFPGASGSARSAGAPGAFAGGPGGTSTSAIAAWVKAHFKAVTIGGQTVYDLTQRTG